ncbi:MAG: selenocysteine-specific translation elongation factor [Acidobacteria bacterium]|nr:selenocysteine-specific translation elongation factor [Acidobacteriota bacterium]
MKRIIIGTAGHIDHGKTTLVKALTGVDTDRLKEEKERGITIDIGFADLTIGELHIGFVDVPGHEKFVKNMLAGAHGIDIVMLVVAADESVMPQTREHFDICRLLEVKAGLVVITKTDMVDEDFLQLVEAEVADFVAGSFLEDAAVVRVSSRTGDGIEILKKELAKLAVKLADRDDKAVARLPIDRVFSVKGFGTVVTGTLISGVIRAGDELELLPSNNRRARARGLQVHSRATTVARAGERTAVNLQGVEVSEIERGQALAPAGKLLSSSIFDVRLHLLKTSPKPLRNRSQVHLHTGTAEITARVVIFGQGELAAGTSCYAQMRLKSPALVLPGDHFIIRSISPVVTIGGGLVLEALANKHRLREAAQVIENLEKLVAADDAERVARFIEMAGTRGMSRAEITARSGLPDEAIDRASEQMVKSQRVIIASRNPLLLVAKPSFEGLAKSLRSMLKDFHRASPLASGMGREEVRERIFAHLPPEVFRAVISYLVEREEMVADKDLLRLADHQVALTAEEQAAKEHLAALYEQAAMQPISLEEAIARSMPQFGIDIQRAKRFAQMLISSGELVRVSDLIFHRSVLESLRKSLARFKLENGPRIDVAQFKELTGVSRKYAIPLLEYLDRQRVTRRVGDARELL